jgi:hypothetical protein
MRAGRRERPEVGLAEGGRVRLGTGRHRPAAGRSPLDVEVVVDGHATPEAVRNGWANGPVLGLTLPYEVDDIRRFPAAGHFLFYSRLVRCEHSSAGKVTGSGPKKAGNAHPKWAFSEAACLMIRAVPAVKGWVQRQEKKKGERKALSVLKANIGRAVYHLWRKQVPFDVKWFLKG